MHISGDDEAHPAAVVMGIGVAAGIVGILVELVEPVPGILVEFSHDSVTDRLCVGNEASSDKSLR